MRTSFLLLSFTSIIIVGCAFAHPADPATDPTPEPAAPPDPRVAPSVDPTAPVAPLAVATHLETCLAEGGRLVEVDSVNNNDSADHGELHTLAVGDDGTIVAGAADGTLKFWTLEAGHRGTASSSFLGYGVEITSARSSDTAFLGSRVVSGDVGGLVTAFAESGEFEVLGGTSPGIAIESVAVDARGTFVAYADAESSGNVILRPVAGGSVIGPLPTTLERVNDVAFLPDGRLVIGGSLTSDLYAGFEVRAAADPMTTMATFHVEGGMPIAEIAVARDGSAIAGVSSDLIVAFDGSLSTPVLELHPDHLASSIAYTPNGTVFFTAGGDGTVRAWTRLGHGLSEVARLGVADPVAVRTDRSGSLVFAGSRDGMIHVLSCER